MKRITYPAIVIFAIALSACGGGGGDETPNTNNGTQGAGTGTQGAGSGTQGSNTGTQDPSPGNTTPPPATLASTAQVIEYYGDSTIWGCDPSRSDCSLKVATPAPEAFRAALPTSPTQTVRNQGLNGDTACAMLNGTGREGDGEGQWSGRNWAQQMAQSNATVVIINHGINDAVRGVPMASYSTCLRNLAQTARNTAGTRKYVIFETPNPIDNDALSGYVAAMRSVASQEGIPIIDQHRYLTTLIGTQDIRTYIPDGTHPSQDTYILKGRYAASEFVKLPR